MNVIKKSVMAVCAGVMLTGSSLFAGSDALIWGFVTGDQGEPIWGELFSVCGVYFDDAPIDHTYMTYLPAGTFTITATSRDEGYNEKSVELVVEDDNDYHIDFVLDRISE